MAATKLSTTRAFLKHEGDPVEAAHDRLLEAAAKLFGRHGTSESELRRAMTMLQAGDQPATKDDAIRAIELWIPTRRNEGAAERLLAELGSLEKAFRRLKLTPEDRRVLASKGKKGFGAERLFFYLASRAGAFGHRRSQSPSDVLSKRGASTLRKQKDRAAKTRSNARR